MINLELIEFADLIRPSDVVTEILKQNLGIEIPIPLEEIAYEAGIEEIGDRPFSGLEGALVANPEKSRGSILVKEGARHHRRRFTIGHELGHFMIPRHGHEMNCSIDDLKTTERSSLSEAQRKELEANQFSAELLMPALQFRAFKGFRDEPSMECLIAQGQYFDVSFEACARRYALLHDEPVAIVFSRNGVVRYSLKNKDFPFWIIPGKGDGVPAQSHTCQLDLDNKSSITSDACDASIWINEKQYYEFPEEIVEEVYVMDDGYVATMLSFDSEILEIE